jgi:hypothetical protein
MLRMGGRNMQNRIEDALRQAVEAREKSLSVGDGPLRAEWLNIAEMWETVAAEATEIESLRVLRDPVGRDLFTAGSRRRRVS